MTEPTSPVERATAMAAPGAPPSALEAGREAFARHAWPEAFDLLLQADAESLLSGPDLEILADAAFFAAKANQRIEVLERAFKSYEATGDRLRAAYIGLDLAQNLILRGKVSLGSAWIRRAEQLLDGQSETYAHAFLALERGELAKRAGDIETAMSLVGEAVAIAARTAHPDLHAMALTALATMKIATGATDEGFALLEEAAFAAVNGELSPITAGITSCSMISACRDLTDYQRASEWLEATDKWCQRQEVSGFPGICRVHRAELVALRGGWDRAEEELRKATTELAAFEAVPPMADGLYAIGEIRRLKGDVDGAEEAFKQSHALGRSPQPALALMRLGAGKIKSAAAAIDAALAEPNWDKWARGRLLAAQVEIAVADGDITRARAAVDELMQVTSGYQSPALDAGRRQALGRVLLAEGDAAGAARELREAIRSWRDVSVPYEVARAQAVLSKALRALGNEDDADLELAAARDEFERLGAKPDLAASEAEIRDLAQRRSRPGHLRKTFMFTDIVGSTTLAGALGDEAWERLLAWHDDTIRRLVERQGGQIVNSTGDGFFAAFDSTPPGIACAISIQRALADHRSASGFAPPVRIGLHTAEATQRGADYSGMGVHVAARVAGLAREGQILISSDTLAEADGIETSEPFEVGIKGVSTPLTVASVSWTA
jgi:class 3 adenylate cyclase